jgi:hypothetical protein
MKLILSAVFALIMVFNLNAAEEEKPQATDVKNQISLAKFVKGLNFINIGEGKPEDFMRAHPCMTGSWEGVRETDTHWIGRLYYPSDNTKEEINFMTADFKIKKDAQIKIDLSKWKGTLILLMPKANSRDDDQIGNAEFTLIAHSKEQNFMNDGISELHKISPYKPK